MGFLNTVKSIFNGKKDELNKAMIEQNPELILDQAIIDAKESHRKDKEKLAKITALHQDQVAKAEVLRTNLRKIQQIIQVDQRKGDMESVKEGTTLFKQREKELEEFLELVTETGDAVNDVTSFLIEKEKEIKNLEAEKANLLAQLASAKAKEDIMNIRDSVGKDSSSTKNYSHAKSVIQDKVKNVKGRQIVENKMSSGTSGSGKFGGL